MLYEVITPAGITEARLLLPAPEVTGRAAKLDTKCPGSGRLRPTGVGAGMPARITPGDVPGVTGSQTERYTANHQQQSSEPRR